MLPGPTRQAHRPGRFRVTDRAEFARRVDRLDNCDVPRVTRDAALGLLSYVWHTASSGPGRYLGSTAALAQLVGVDPRTLRRTLLPLLEQAGLLAAVPGGLQVLDPALLERTDGPAGWERTPRATFRVLAATLAAEAGRTSRPARAGRTALAALGAYERVRCGPLGRWRGRSRPRHVIVAAHHRHADPAAAVARQLGLHRTTWAAYAAALTAAGFLVDDGRGHRLAGLHDLACVPEPAPQEGQDVHPTDTSADAEVHSSDTSERALRKTGPAKDLDDDESAGHAAAAGGDGTAETKTGRADLRAAAQTGTSSLKNGEHPHLDHLVQRVVQAQDAYSWLRRPADPARALLDKYLHAGLPWHDLLEAALFGRYFTGTAPTKVMAEHMRDHLDERLRYQQETKAQAATWQRRRWTPAPAGGSQRGRGFLSSVTPPPPRVADVLDQVLIECVHGERSCTRCPACVAGRPDELTGAACTRCRSQDVTGTADGTPPAQATPPARARTVQPGA